MIIEHYMTDDIYLYIVKLALEKYSLEIPEFYKLLNRKEIFTHPDIVRRAYVALDLWKTEKFIGLDCKYHNEAKHIYLALLNS